MAGFFKRMSSIFKANANAALDAAEDPEKMINQMIRDMEEQMGQARKGVAQAIAAEKRLEKEYMSHKESVDKWEGRAKQAIGASNDDLAKKALVRRNEATEQVTALEPQLQAARANSEKLKSRLRELDAKIQQARRKRGSIVARQKAVEAQKKIQDTMGSLNDSSAFDTFARMEAKVSELEHLTDAEAELSDDLKGEDLDAEFAQLSSGGAVDDELAALKAQLKGGDSSGGDSGKSE